MVHNDMEIGKLNINWHFNFIILVQPQNSKITIYDGTHTFKHVGVNVPQMFKCKKTDLRRTYISPTVYKIIANILFLNINLYLLLFVKSLFCLYFSATLSRVECRGSCFLSRTPYLQRTF